MGGVKRLFSVVKGHGSTRYHTLLARIMVLPLILSSLTGIYLTLTDFELIMVSNAESIEYPQSQEGPLPVAPAKLQGLADIPMDQLIELKFPMIDDPEDIFTAITAQGLISIDQFSGEVLEFVPATTSEVIFQWFHALHTGEGLAVVGFVSRSCCFVSAGYGYHWNCYPKAAAAGKRAKNQRQSQGRRCRYCCSSWF